jgi:hypothetical protein
LAEDERSTCRLRRLARVRLEGDLAWCFTELGEFHTPLGKAGQAIDPEGGTIALGAVAVDVRSPSHVCSCCSKRVSFLNEYCFVEKCDRCLLSVQCFTRQCLKGLVLGGSDVFVARARRLVMCSDQSTCSQVEHVRHAHDVARARWLLVARARRLRRFRRTPALARSLALVYAKCCVNFSLEHSTSTWTRL